MFAGNFAPSGWAFCDGSLLPISENDALFTLIGTTYGGDGESTFALPDLRGRIPIHSGVSDQGPAFGVGASGGAEEIELTVAQLPRHTHAFPGAAVEGAGTPPVRAQSRVPRAGASPGADVSAPETSPTGGGRSHTNLQPSVCVNFIISLDGIFPSQN